MLIHPQPPSQDLAIFTYATGRSFLETVFIPSQLQIFRQGYSEQPLIERENADTKHLDASLSVSILLLKRRHKSFRVLKQFLIAMTTVFILWFSIRPQTDQYSALKRDTTQDRSRV